MRWNLAVYTRLWFSLCSVLQTGSAQNVGKQPCVFSLVLQFSAFCILSSTYEAKSQNLDFHNRTVHPDKSFIHPTECTTRLKFTLKYFTLKCSYVFRFTNHHQGAYYCALLKLCLLKQSVKIRRYECSAVMWLHNYSVLLVYVLYAVHRVPRTAHTNRTQ